MTRPESPSHWIARVGPRRRSGTAGRRPAHGPAIAVSGDPVRAPAAVAPALAPPRRPPQSVEVCRNLEGSNNSSVRAAEAVQRRLGARPRHRRLRFRDRSEQLSYPAAASPTWGAARSVWKCGWRAGSTSRPGPLSSASGSRGMAGAGGAAGAVNPGSGAEARIEGDRTYLRPAGGEWKR